MLPSNIWNMNIYNKSWVLYKKKLHKDSNMGMEKITLCSFLITIICLLRFIRNDRSTDSFYKPVNKFSSL